MTAAMKTETSDTHDFVILHGTLAPEGCVMQGAGFSRDPYQARARVFATETAAIAAIDEGRVASGEAIVIAAADTGEMSAIFAAIARSGLKDIALISNGRFADTGKATTISHAGRLMRYVQNADTITIDIKGRRLDIDADIEARCAQAPLEKPGGGKVKNGFAPLAKYAAMLSSATQAAETAAQ